jgi:hypothetical protein
MSVASSVRNRTRGIWIWHPSRMDK